MSFDHAAEWPGLKSLAEAGDSAGLLATIGGIEDDGARISLYRFVIRKLAFDDWENKNLDVMIALADAAIADCENLAGDFLQQANLICFNTAANLADCWADGFNRELRHFEKGLAYAKKGAWYRDHLDKPNGSKAMAQWAIGKHSQSLGLIVEARAAYGRALEFETLAAAEAGKPAEISSEGPAGYLIAAGYVALLDGDAIALGNLVQVCEAMVAAGGTAKAEAEIIVLQLRETARLMGSPLPQLFEASSGARS